MMKIELGKSYRTPCGDRAEVVLNDGSDMPFEVAHHTKHGIAKIWHFADGRSCFPIRDRDLIAEWTDIDLSNPLGQVFGLMPPETQEAMKAHGGPWEWFGAGGWRNADPLYAEFLQPYNAYRVKPAPIRETVTLIGNVNSGFDYSGWTTNTHRIQFDLIDGKPDCASIKMEPLE
jgi:hypothetical protein